MDGLIQVAECEPPASTKSADESQLARAGRRGRLERNISKGRRNKSELSGSPLRGKQVFCELQFQSLICSHNKGGIIRRRGNLRSSFQPPHPHPPPPAHTHPKNHHLKLLALLITGDRKWPAFPSSALDPADRKSDILVQIHR